MENRKYTYDIVWKDGSTAKLIASTASLIIALNQYGYNDDKIQDIAEWRRTAHNITKKTNNPTRKTYRKIKSQ